MSSTKDITDPDRHLYSKGVNEASHEVVESTRATVLIHLGRRHWLFRSMGVALMEPGTRVLLADSPAVDTSGRLIGGPSSVTVFTWAMGRGRWVIVPEASIRALKKRPRPAARLKVPRRPTGPSRVKGLQKPSIRVRKRG